jgi:hypothetical protein
VLTAVVGNHAGVHCSAVNGCQMRIAGVFAPTKHGGTCASKESLPDMCKPHLLQIVWVAAEATITASLQQLMPLAAGLCRGRNDGVVQHVPCLVYSWWCSSSYEAIRCCMLLAI